MTISFFEPNEIPQPKDKVKIELFTAHIYPDRWRVKVDIHVSAFQVRPNLGVVLLKDQEAIEVIADMAIIETMHHKMEFTLHIRRVDDPQGNYVLKTRLYYDDIHAPNDAAEIKLHIPSETDMSPDGLLFSAD